MLTASGDFVDDHFAGSGYFHILIDGRKITPWCDKKTNLISQTRWVECPIPNQGYDPGQRFVRLVRYIGGSDILGPVTSFMAEPPPTTTTLAAPTTTTQPPITTTLAAPTTTTQPPITTTSEAVATTAAEPELEETATTLVRALTTTTQIISTTTEQTPSTTFEVVAAEENDPGSGGPSWLVVALVAALAVAITVIVMQNLERTRTRD
jgi:hypothetical protein